MKLLFTLFLTISSVTFADTCKPELKFGTKVKIINSTYSEWANVNFIKGLNGNILNAYTSKYKTECKNDRMVEVSVCIAAHKNCKEFSLCETDVEILKEF